MALGVGPHHPSLPRAGKPSPNVGLVFRGRPFPFSLEGTLPDLGGPPSATSIAARIIAGVGKNSDGQDRAGEGLRGSNVSGTAGRGVFAPLAFLLGEAFQFDWSEDWAIIGGERTKLQVAHFKLSYSRAFILRAYPQQTQELVFDAITTPSACSAACRGGASTTIYGRLPHKAICWGSGWNARIYPACCGTVRVPGLDGSPRLLAS
jgi:hypothetical protein